VNLQPLLGLAGATGISLISVRLRALTTDGAAAAILVGTMVYAAGGLPWALVLLLFFASGSALSRVPQENAECVAEKGGQRDGLQVLANGGVAALSALVQLLSPASLLPTPGFAGAIAAATADTWATEIGTRWGGSPRLLFTRASVPRGTSGAVTALGLAASLLGAAAIGLASFALFDSARYLVAATVGGIVGSLTDSLVGATLQVRRQCPVCGTWTEHRLHAVCRARTTSIGGVSWVTNDTVNVAATLVGAFASVVVFSL
jgi:uncharacterized protein (TIGR00297 family)